MELDPRSNTIGVKSTEPFGRLLLDLMYNSSLDEQILKVQRYVGAVLIEAYINDKLVDLESLYADNYEHVFNRDMARDISKKAELYARENTVMITFEEEHYQGVENISRREANDLPMLLAEREIVSVAVDIGYIPEEGRYVDETELQMIEEEIEQATAAKELLEHLNKIKGKNL